MSKSCGRVEGCVEERQREMTAVRNLNDLGGSTCDFINEPGGYIPDLYILYTVGYVYELYRYY